MKELVFREVKDLKWTSFTRIMHSFPLGFYFFSPIYYFCFLQCLVQRLESYGIAILRTIFQWLLWKFYILYIAAVRVHNIKNIGRIWNYVLKVCSKLSFSNSSYLMDTSQLIWSASQMTRFYKLQHISLLFTVVITFHDFYVNTSSDYHFFSQ